MGRLSTGAHIVVDAAAEAVEEVGGEVGLPAPAGSEEVEVLILLVRVFSVKWCWSFVGKTHFGIDCRKLYT